MKIKPIGERVLVKTQVTEEKTSSGLYIPQTAQEKTQIGVVAAIGDSKDITVKVGERVLYDKYAGTIVKDGAEEYLIAKMEDILAVIE